jgi:hypothetical protein
MPSSGASPTLSACMPKVSPVIVGLRLRSKYV